MLTLRASQACAQDADDQRNDEENNAANLGQLSQLGVHAALTAGSHRSRAFAHDSTGQALTLLLLRKGKDDDQQGKDLVHFFNEDGLGAIVNSSRGIIAAYKQEAYAKFGPENFGDASRAAVEAMVADISGALAAAK